MKTESRMPGYCSYISLMGVSNKIKKKKKTSLGFGQKVENVLKNDHII